MANMRRLLQSTIEYLETEKKEVWLNAEVTVFDDFGNTIIMVSGGGRHKFTVSNNGNNETEVVNTKRPGFFYRLKSHFCEGIQPLQAIEDVNDTVNQDVKDSVNPSSGLVACWQA